MEVAAGLEQTIHGVVEESEFDRLRKRLHYAQQEIKDRSGFQRLANTLTSSQEFASNIVFYLSISPEYYSRVARALAAVELNSEEAGWRRLVVEKTFGLDLESARSLGDALHRCFAEHQIYRIDHYPGMETVIEITPMELF